VHPATIVARDFCPTSLFLEAAPEHASNLARIDPDAGTHLLADFSLKLA
jgi:hypothetical protein